MGPVRSNDTPSDGSRHFVDSLHAAFAAAPPPRNDPPRTLLMLSAGLDSTALLNGLLRETDHSVHAHHIEIVNGENRADAEMTAVQRVLEYSWEHCRDFDYSSSQSVFHIGWGGYDITLAMFVAARIQTATELAADFVVTGHRVPGTSRAELVEAASVFNAFFLDKAGQPTWIRPLSGVSKDDLLDYLPSELAAATWSCRQPVLTDDGPEPCGECHACKSPAGGIER